jgi:hypothetical protein
MVCMRKERKGKRYEKLRLEAIKKGLKKKVLLIPYNV